MINMYGWFGKILKVDLTSCRIWREDIEPELLREYIGGRGLGVRLLRDFFRLDPFDPEIPLIFATGPLCGSPAPSSARLAIVSRSPLTGTVMDSSCGGSLALRLKGSGIDALHIVGAAKTPVMLLIDGEKAQIIPAETLWGRGVKETLRTLSPRGSVAAIGPAGENGVLFAGIMTGDGDCSTRGGLGAVMGRKMLKAIVVDGRTSTKVANPGCFDSAVKDMMRLFLASPFLFGELGIANYGTPALLDLIRQRRMTPTENFRKTFFEDSSLYSGAALRKHFKTMDNGCMGCPIQCIKKTQDGEALPDYDTISHFGALNNIKSLSDIIGSSMACHDLGLEAVSAAATISAWGEWRGRFAEGDEIGKLLKDIAHRNGDGELLSLGSRRAMTVLGVPGLSMSVKSLELPAYDPRGAYGLALAYCTSNRGGCHMAALPISHEILRKPVATDRFSLVGKARINKIAEDAIAAIDSMATCRLTFLGATLEEFSELLTATTGMEYTSGLLGKIGERIFLTERYYNTCNGFTETDDRLPERFHMEEGSGGDGIDIPPIDRQAFLEELLKYYRIRGLKPDGTFSDNDFLLKQP